MVYHTGSKSAVMWLVLYGKVELAYDERPETPEKVDVRKSVEYG